MCDETRVNFNGFPIEHGKSPHDGERYRTADPPRPTRARRRHARNWLFLVGLLLMTTSAILTVSTLIWLSRQASRLSIPWAEAMTAAAFLLLAAWILASGRPRARRVALEDHLRSRRVAVYSGLIDHWGVDPGGVGNLSAIWPLERQLALIGSAQVLAQYVALQNFEPSPGAEADACLGALIVEMRRDILPTRSWIESDTLARLAKKWL